MGCPPCQAYPWYLEDDSLEDQLPVEAHMAGLPETWRHYEWKVAAILFAVLWLVDTWTAGEALSGAMSLNHLGQGLWLLLLVLTVSAGLLHLWTRRLGLGFRLSALIAVSALVGYSF